MVTPRPFFSIIIPTYNSSTTLANCVESILAQTFKDFELIIVDGLSKDNTVRIAEQYAENGKNIQWISEGDNGVYDAMNKGILLSHGQWLYFLGSDDEMYDENVLEKVSKADLRGLGFLYGDVKIAGNTSWASDNDIYDGEFDCKKLFKKNICQQAIFYNRELFKKEGCFNTTYKICADYAFNLLIFSKSKGLYIPVVISRFNAGGLSTVEKDEAFFKVFWEIILQHYWLKLFNIHFSEFYGSIRFYFINCKPKKKVRFFFRALSLLGMYKFYFMLSGLNLFKHRRIRVIR